MSEFKGELPCRKEVTSWEVSVSLQSHTGIDSFNISLGHLPYFKIDAKKHFPQESRGIKEEPAEE